MSLSLQQIHLNAFDGRVHLVHELFLSIYSARSPRSQIILKQSRKYNSSNEEVNVFELHPLAWFRKTTPLFSERRCFYGWTQTIHQQGICPTKLSNFTAFNDGHNERGMVDHQRAPEWNHSTIYSQRYRTEKQRETSPIIESGNQYVIQYIIEREHRLYNALHRICQSTMPPLRAFNNRLATERLKENWLPYTTAKNINNNKQLYG